MSGRRIVIISVLMAVLGWLGLAYLGEQHQARSPRSPHFLPVVVYDPDGHIRPGGLLPQPSLRESQSL
jgi:hypothetical protein